jgi:hypothetical protein
MNKHIVELNDTSDVIWTATVLGITEFEVFGAAYHAWFHEPADERLLESHFVPYMFEGVAPYWVRQFTRFTRNDCPEPSRTGVSSVDLIVKAAVGLATILPAGVLLMLATTYPPPSELEPSRFPA